jgi:hypothetical protein
MLANTKLETQIILTFTSAVAIIIIAEQFPGETASTKGEEIKIKHSRTD